jgi:hypothetical protein
MIVLHPLDPLDRRRPDDVYAAEAAACDRLGIGWTLIDHDALVQGDVDWAVRRVPVQPCPVTGVYRGWMATVEQYALFYQTLEGGEAAGRRLAGGRAGRRLGRGAAREGRHRGVLPGAGEGTRPSGMKGEQMSDVRPKTIEAGGSVMALALAAPDRGYLLVRTEQEIGRLLSLDLQGCPRGQLDLPGPPGYPSRISRRQLRVAEDGSAWLGMGRPLTRIGAEGSVRGVVEVSSESDEELGIFLLVPGGFVAALHKPASREVRGRVLRLDAEGGVSWSRIVPPGDLAYAGVVEMGVDSGWQIRPKRPWQPRDWQPGWRGDPLLLSGDRLLARFFEVRSGLGRTFCLDWASGRILWATEPRPEDSVALVGPGRLLLGVQRYGVFDLYLHNRDGTVLQHWPRHAEAVVTEGGEIRGVEMENCLPSPMHFSVFEPDGKVRQGPHLDG